MYFEERRPQDHVMLIVHHLVTIELIIVSYVTCINGHGMTTLFLLIVPDVFLYVGRFIVTLVAELRANGIKIPSVVYKVIYADLFLITATW